jgi:hypothetical protein
MRISCIAFAWEGSGFWVKSECVLACEQQDCGRAAAAMRMQGGADDGSALSRRRRAPPRALVVGRSCWHRRSVWRAHHGRGRRRADGRLARRGLGSGLHCDVGYHLLSCTDRSSDRVISDGPARRKMSTHGGAARRSRKGARVSARGRGGGGGRRRHRHHTDRHLGSRSVLSRGREEGRWGRGLGSACVDASLGRPPIRSAGQSRHSM